MWPLRHRVPPSQAPGDWGPPHTRAPSRPCFAACAGAEPPPTCSRLRQCMTVPRGACTATIGASASSGLQASTSAWGAEEPRAALLVRRCPPVCARCPVGVRWPCGASRQDPRPGVPCLRRYSCGRQGECADPKGAGLQEGPPGLVWCEGTPPSGIAPDSAWKPAHPTGAVRRAGFPGGNLSESWAAVGHPLSSSLPSLAGPGVEVAARTDTPGEGGRKQSFQALSWPQRSPPL